MFRVWCMQHRLIGTVEKNISVQKDNIAKLNSLITLVRIKYDDGKYEEALEVLGVRFAKDEVAHEKLQQLTKMSLIAKEEELPAMLDNINVSIILAIVVTHFYVLLFAKQ
jgi:hypothetical protein